MVIINPRKRRGVILLSSLLILVVAGVSGYFVAKILIPQSNNTAGDSSTKKANKPQLPPKPTFNKAESSNADPTSLWVVVNKHHPLNPKTYTPTDLVTASNVTISQKVQADFETMLADAKTAGINLKLVSSYRSYDTQSAVYNNYVSIYGQARTDTFSARPGYSEHQTGLAIDFGSFNQTNCDLDDCFGQTPEGVWLATNAPEYGFLLRYPVDRQSVTGYKSEPWHYRYVGKKLIDEMQKQGITTLEEFFGISGGEAYI